jgi:hypothetical protein
VTSPPARHPLAAADPQVTPHRLSPDGQTPVVQRNHMAHLAIALIRRPASPARSQIGSRHGVVYLAVYLCMVVLRLAGAGLMVGVAAIHLDLWSEGYRHIPTDGPLFLADAIGGFVLAVLLLVWPRPWAGLLGAGFMASTLVTLILSINVGLFGFQESIRASFVVESILLESLGAVALLAWTVIVLQAQSKRPSTRRDRRADAPE